MDLETFIVTVYCLVDDFMKQNFQDRKLRQRGFEPKLSDAEVLTMEIVGEYVGQETDKGIYQYFKRHWSHWFPDLPDRSNFLRQAANLWAVKMKLFESLQEGNAPYIQILDSFPLPVCEFIRAKRSKLFRGFAAYGKWMGETFYGFRLHLKLNVAGTITGFQIAPANCHDLALVPELTGKDTYGWTIGDKAFDSAPARQELLENQHLCLYSPLRGNRYFPLPLETCKKLNSFRRRIESVFAQFTQRFRMKRLWARDLWHLTVRITRKILAHLFAVLLNLQLGRPALSIASLVD